MGGNEDSNWFFRVSRFKVYLFALVIRIFLIGFFGESWDIYVFIESTKQFVDLGVTPYQVALSKPPYIYMPYYPFIENWFAYPPLMLLIFSFFYILAKMLGLTSPFFVRFFIKLPVSLSDLLLAHMVCLLLRDFDVPPEKRRYAELLILYNPFLVLLSTVWGVFDGFVTTLILISIYYIIRDQHMKSSIFIALAALTKQTALFFTPIIFAYWARKKGLFRALVYSATALFIFITVSVPFYLSSPRGFMQQVLLMHVARPPWGYNIYTAVYYIIVFVSTPFVTLNEQLLLLIIDLISAVALSLFFVSLIFLAGRVYSDKKSDNLILYGLLAYLSFVFLNKVSNEPYFTYGLVFLLLYAFKNDNKKMIRLYTNFSYSLFTATLIAAVRFVIFLPSDILKFLFGQDIAEALWELSPYYGESGPLVVVTLFIAAMIILPELINLFLFYLENISPTLHGDLFTLIWGKTLGKLGSSKVLKSLFNFLKKISSFKNLTALLTILLLFYHIYYAPPLTASSINNEPQVTQKWPVIAIHYTWMSNPTHDPNIRDGDWIYSYLTPIEGYYESKESYMVGDLELIKDTGFSAILIEIYPGRSQKASVLATRSIEMGISVAPYIDLGRLFSLSYLANMNPDLGNGTTVKEFYALKDTTSSQILNTIYEGSSLHTLPNALKYKNNYTIFIDGVHLVLPSFDPESIGYQIESMFYYFNITQFNTTALYETLSNRWGVPIDSLDDIYAVYPSNITELLERNDIIARDARSIYVFSFERFWREIIYETKNLLKNVTIIAAVGEDPLNLINKKVYQELFDSVYFSKYQFKEIALRYSDENKTISFLDLFNDKTDFKSVFFYIANTSAGPKPYSYTYKQTLQEAINGGHNDQKIIIVFSWNDYINGFVIEPTKELGYQQIDITKQYLSTEEKNVSYFLATDVTEFWRRKKK